MIRITRISNLRNMGNWKEEFDEVWAIVRSLKTPIDGVIQVPELSPSTELFWRYRALANAGNWNSDTFKEIYVPQFLAEMTGKSARKKLAYLYDAEKKEGKKICLLCFCQDETTCHRSIVAGLLQAVGMDVVLDTQNDYSAYYQDYLRLMRK